MGKPTGTSGFFRVQVRSNGDVLGSFEKTAFPAEKSAVELQIVNRFIASMNMGRGKSEDRFFLRNPSSNKESDFDVTVSTPRGPAYLELMEIAPLAGPYGQAPSNYKPYDLAKTILFGVLEKSNRYAKDAGQPIFLLLYITHWAFTLSGTTIACLRYWLKAQPTLFRAILTYEPIDENEGEPHWLFPVPPDLIGSFDPEQYKENVCQNLNPQGWQAVHERKP
ncbi:MAG TPA: hypothetical protein VGW39_06470 [Chthoniobacterales bacterium]|nr:hypothetical protein [Chthoniobacterales bacterium]